jgi:hypothetical protein
MAIGITMVWGDLILWLLKNPAPGFERPKFNGIPSDARLLALNLLPWKDPDDGKMYGPRFELIFETSAAGGAYDCEFEVARCTPAPPIESNIDMVKHTNG